MKNIFLVIGFLFALTALNTGCTKDEKKNINQVSNSNPEKTTTKDGNTKKETGIIKAKTGAAFQSNGSEYRIEVCESFREDSPGQELFVNALIHLSHFEVVRDSLQKLEAQGLKYCATGVPLKKDIYKNYMYFSQIEVRDSDDTLVKLIPTLYVSPSVQADHNAPRKTWTALSKIEIEPHLLKLADDFTAAHSIENFELDRAADLLPVAQQQSWWNKIDETASNFQFTPIYQQGSSEFYIGGWMKTESPNATLYAQDHSPKVVIFKYDRAEKKLEFSAVDSSFDSIYIPADELLFKAAAEEPKEYSDKADFFIKLGDL